MKVELEVNVNRGFLEVLVDDESGPAWVHCSTMEKLLETLTGSKVIAISTEPGD